MVQCKNCGFLALRGKNGELLESPIDYREQGEHGIVVTEGRPLCFAMVPALREEAKSVAADRQKVLEVIRRDRDCQAFTAWQQGFSPKEHRQMLETERLREWQRKVEQEDRAYRDEQRQKDVEYRDRQEALSRRAIHVQMWLLGLIVPVIQILTAIVTAWIQAKK